MPQLTTGAKRFLGLITSIAVVAGGYFLLAQNGPLDKRKPTVEPPAVTSSATPAGEPTAPATPTHTASPPPPAAMETPPARDPALDKLRTMPKL